jgi:hypothetical protein
MQFSMGFWDWLFGEKIRIELSDGRSRTVTKRWWDEMQRQGKVTKVTDCLVRVHLLRPTAAMLFDAMAGNPIPTYQLVHSKIGEEVSEDVVRTHRDLQTGDMYAILMSKLVDRQNMKMKIVPEFCTREYWNQQAEMNAVDPK